MPSRWQPVFCTIYNRYFKLPFMNWNASVPVLITGIRPQIAGIAACLYLAGHPVTVWSNDVAAIVGKLEQHLNDKAIFSSGRLQVVHDPPTRTDFPIAFICTKEVLAEKRRCISELEKLLPLDALIAVNSDSILLSEIQKAAMHPARVIGANWTEPAQITSFLELIGNDTTDPRYLDALSRMANAYWGKRPYILYRNEGIRGRMMAAMAREALFLVENGYASITDIDRACRNDAGYYLPFAGNFRYMDLMGPHAYGRVMQDLNPELYAGAEMPPLLDRIVNEGGFGMENNKGFYTYSEEEKLEWQRKFAVFSHQIAALMQKYPFSYDRDQ